ncbi:helix-turn-helix domain-containing protein [Adlercreutzia equolifaciens]|uniref:helix-turn-helix domain-containing protein n=1 Tax=Adlercreutzia equolifaciens TaxID=446660 RepID=UPI0022E96405|nr:helix-turn-helix domain-containing protein [Adlercreutzia equolifaciens]
MEFAERCDIVDAIVGAVGERFGVLPEEMLDHRQEMNVVSARQVAIYLCVEFAQLSLCEVGEQFDCDCLSVLHSVSAVESRVREDKEFAQTVGGLIGALRTEYGVPLRIVQ